MRISVKGDERLCQYGHTVPFSFPATSAGTEFMLGRGFARRQSIFSGVFLSAKDLVCEIERRVSRRGSADQITALVRYGLPSTCILEESALIGF